MPDGRGIVSVCEEHLLGERERATEPAASVGRRPRVARVHRLDELDGRGGPDCVSHDPISRVCVSGRAVVAPAFPPAGYAPSVDLPRFGVVEELRDRTRQAIGDEVGDGDALEHVAQ